jgi:hypothetical protein
MAIVVGMLASGIGNVKIMISVFSFNLLWIFIDVYQMATFANVDHSGSYTSLMPGAWDRSSDRTSQPRFLEQTWDIAQFSYGAEQWRSRGCLFVH